MSLYYYGKRTAHHVDHKYLIKKYCKSNILFRGSLTEDGDERFRLRHVFPGRFFNKSHYDHVHGVLLDGNARIDVWGVRDGKLFVRTMEGDYYFSSIISECYNSCAYDEEFYKTRNGSNWSKTIADLIEFSNRADLFYYP